LIDDWTGCPEITVSDLDAEQAALMALSAARFSLMPGEHSLDLPTPDLITTIWQDVLGLPTNQNCPVISMPIPIPLCGGISPVNDVGPGPDPVAVANSMRQYVKNMLIINPLHQLVKEGICGGSPSGAFKEGRVGGAIKGGTLGAIEGYAGTGVLAGTTFAGPGGAILGGIIGGTIGSVAGVFSGGITAGICQASGVYDVAW
jgi:hypothetical protein